MAIDAGSIASEVRIKLDLLQKDISEVNKSFDKLGKDIAQNSKTYSETTGAKYKTALKEVAQETNKASDAFAKLNSVAGSFGIGVSIAAAINYIKGAVVEFSKAEQAAQTLDRALQLKGLDSARAGLVDLAEKLQRVGVEDADVTKQLEAQLIASGRSESQTKALIVASAGLSSVTGDSLSGSLEALNKTLEGVSPRSAELKAIMGDLTVEELKNGEGIKRVIENYSAFIGKTGSTAVALKQVKFALDDVTEAVGGAASGGVKKAAPLIVEMAQSFEKLIPKLAQGYKDFLQLKGVFAVLAPIMAPVAAAIAGFGGAFQVIAALIRGDIPGALNRLGKTALDVIGQLLTPIKSVVDMAIGGINLIIGGLNKIPGMKKIDLVKEFNFFGLTDQMKKWGDELDASYSKILKNAGIATDGLDATKSAAERAAEALQRLKDLQKENAELAKSIIDGQKSEAVKLYEQWSKLAQTPAANGELEKERQEALLILTKLIKEAAAKEIADANKVAQAKIDADKKAADAKYAAFTDAMDSELEAYRKAKKAEVDQDEAAKDKEKEIEDEALKKKIDAWNTYSDYAMNILNAIADLVVENEKRILDKDLEILEKRIDAEEDAADEIYENQTKAAEEAYRAQTKAAEKSYRDQQKAADEMFSGQMDALEEWYQLSQDLIEYDGKTKMESLQDQLDKAIADGDTVKASEIQKQIDSINLRVEYEAKKKALEDEQRAAKEAAEIAYEQRKEAREKAYDEEKTAREKENEAAREAREKKALYDKAMLEYKYAKTKWGWDLAQAISKTGLAVLEGFITSNYAGSIYAGILGALQIASVAGAQPQPPAMATGGLVLPSGGGSGTPVMAGDRGGGDIMFGTSAMGSPLMDAFIEKVASRAAEKMASATNITIHNVIPLDGKVIAQSTVRFINNGQVKVNP
jgi:hypothetical protein